MDERGYVKTLKIGGAYGWIRTARGDVFFHQNAPLKREAFQRLKSAQRRQIVACAAPGAPK